MYMYDFAKEMKKQRARHRKWMANEGTTRSIDLGHRLFDDFIEQMDVQPIDETTVNKMALRVIPTMTLHDSSTGLAVLVRSLSDTIKQTVGTPRELVDHFGLRSAEYDFNFNDFTFGDGLADQDFTWHFAPFLAHEVIKAAIRNGHAPEDALERMSLGDWAHIYECGWFSDLVHECAMTGPGMYADRGRASLRHYDIVEPVGLIPGQSTLLTKTFEFETVVEEVDELGERLEHVVARLSPSMKRELQYAKQQGNSVGCPVARKQFSVSHEQAKTDPYLRRLLQDEIVAEVPPTHESALGQNSLRLVQIDGTPIDRSLSLLARAFETYDQRYGSPLVGVFDGSVSHDTERPLLLPLQRDITPPDL